MSIDSSRIRKQLTEYRGTIDNMIQQATFIDCLETAQGRINVKYEFPYLIDGDLTYISFSFDPKQDTETVHSQRENLSESIQNELKKLQTIHDDIQQIFNQYLCEIDE